jgi:hypothetical protein
MDSNTTMEITNERLEEAIKVYAADHSTANLQTVINLLMPTRLMVPAMLKAPNQPIPCMLKNGKQEQFLAVYTSKAQIPKEPKSQAMLSMPFKNCCEVTLKDELSIFGIVVNPFSDNLVIKKELVEKIYDTMQKAANTKQVKMTPAQYTVFVKKQVEFGLLPKRLYTEKADFVNKICDEKEAFINRIFADAFREQKLYPYSENDYSVMALDIAEDMTLIRVDLPERDMAAQLALRVYITYDPTKDVASYFLIEATAEKDVRNLGGIAPDGKHTDYGEAPVEGAELSHIIELARSLKAESGLTS